MENGMGRDGRPPDFELAMGLSLMLEILGDVPF